VTVIAVTYTGRLGDYLEALRVSGADPLVVGAGDNPAGLLDRVRGVLLTGGGDIDPRLYGEEPDATFDPAEVRRDGFEIDLVLRAIERDLPVLGICRGAQVLNVACGGTLVQDIPTSVPRALGHRQATPRDGHAHVVSVDAGSLLGRVLANGAGSERVAIGVNSRHHQAVKRLATGLVATADAQDGVVEAIERPASRFCLAVQWHPENFLRTGEFAALFAAFVRACSEDRDSQPLDPLRSAGPLHRSA
jgi:putative glutamine amidotransferase